MKQATWKWVLALGLALSAIAAPLTCSSGNPLAVATVGVLVGTVMLAAVRRHTRPAQLGWLLLALGTIAVSLGEGLTDLGDPEHGSHLTLGVTGATLYIVGLPTILFGVLRMSRGRGLVASVERHLDSGIVCAGIFGLCWQFFISAPIGVPGLSTSAHIVATVQPVLDLVLIYVISSALLAGVTRRAGDRLYMLGLIALLVSDIIHGVMLRYEAREVDHLSDVVILLFFVCSAAAVLHPDTRLPLVAPPDTGLRMARWLPFFALAGAASPFLMLISAAVGVRVNLAVLAVTSLILFTLIVARFYLLFRRINAQNLLLTDRSESLQDALVAQQALETDLRHLAFHDGLTGLANRALLHDRVEQALSNANRSRGLVALCFCDLDGFKKVNDSLGHQVGDELLVIASKRLASVSREAGTVARLGDDEFAILITGVSDPNAITALAERIIAVLREPVSLAGSQLTLSASVGISFADEQTSTEELISQADTAMYEAKNAGKDQFAVFESAMRARLIEQMTITNAFAGALERGEFFLEYEPQTSSRDGRLEGFEALVRWDHPVLGKLSPVRFISIAEETGFIQTLGRWILEAACVAAVNWRTASNAPLSVSVNISARQLDDPLLVQDIWNALSFSGLHPRRLILEVTETMLMGNPERAAQTLSDLKRMGIRIAIDDFGTGYSSLSHLQRFPVDILKIDKSFIDPLDDPASEGRAFVETILRLARDLGLATIAEGVETERQRETLTRLRCDSLQGYLLSRPMPTPAVLAYITANDRRATTRFPATSLMPRSNAMRAIGD